MHIARTTAGTGRPIPAESIGSNLNGLLAVSAITSALIVGTSIIVAFGKGPALGGVNLYNNFVIGAIIGGALMLFSIWREKS